MEFRKDLSHLSWEEVFARQQRRAALIPTWLDGLHLQVGDHVLDLGAGPGYVSLQLAERVGPTGLVYAVDRSAEALAYLQKLMQQHAVVNIRPIVADVLSLRLDDDQVSAALLAMMLHHTDQPAALLNKLATLLPEGGWAVIAEFHPNGPGLEGPPRVYRLLPQQIEAWCQEAGLHVVRYQQQSAEHYMLLVHKPSTGEGVIQGQA